MRIGKKKWACSAYPVHRYEFMTSNATESFNKRILWAMTLPVTSVLEILRMVAEKWFYERNEATMSPDHELTEAAERELGYVIKRGSKLKAVNLQNNMFKVKDRLGMHKVDMSTKTCTCHEFDTMLIPCMHATAAARKMSVNLHTYVDDYYRMSTLRVMWSDTVMLIPNSSTWNIPDEVRSIICLPPDNPKQAGRPKTTRKSAGPECASSSSRKKQLCKRCGGSVHNHATCNVYMEFLEVEPDQVPDSSDNIKCRAPRKCSICKSINHLKNKCPHKQQQLDTFDDE